MNIKKEEVQNALNKICKYIEESDGESVFRLKVIPIMIKTVNAFTPKLTMIEQEGINAAKLYWESDGNSTDLKRVRYRLINHKHSISHSKSSIEYFRIEAILKTLYTFEEWEDEDSCTLAYFGSDLIEAGIKLDFFYNELCVVFNDVVIE